MEFTILEFGAVGGEGGCEVHVVGDHPALGCWSPAQSVPLHPSGTSEGLPFWKTRTPISVPSGTTIQYKYLLMKDGLLHRWENFEGNRVCADVQGSSMCLLEDELDKLFPLLVFHDVRARSSDTLSRARQLAAACIIFHSRARSCRASLSARASAS